MLVGPSKAILKLVRQLVPKVTPKEIADSVRRLDIRIESPAVTLPDAAHPRPRRSGSVKPPKATGEKADRAGPAVSLTDLIGAALIKPGTRLFRRYRGHDIEATLLPDSSVRFKGQDYRTCSTAAEVARGTVSGRRMNTNGWVFWQFADATGKSRTLDTPRRAFRERWAPSSATPPLRLAGDAPAAAG